MGAQAIKTVDDESIRLNETVVKASSDHAPVDVVLGTKAQYIKTAPVLRELTRRNIPYRLIDTGQHAGLTPDLRRDLGVKDPDIILADNGNVATIASAFLWAMRIALETLFKPQKIKQDYFSPQSSYCLIHGDTPSTLLSLFLAKRAGKKVVHIEAGLRSYNYLKPFPEEIIRIICMRYADILFTPSKSATENLEKMNVKGRIVALPQNTNVEALYHSLNEQSDHDENSPPFALFTVHRVETIFNKDRLEFIMRWVTRIADELPVVFVLHDPTKHRMEAAGFMDELENHPNITVRPLMAHTKFAQLLSDCAFVVTDGGSIQEEAFFLDTPCLVMRTETEREEGIGGNVRIGGFDDQIMTRFMADYKNLQRGFREKNLQPSKMIVDRLIA